MSYRKYLMTDDVPPSELYKTVKIGTDSDTISRQQAIEVIDSFNVFESRCDQIKLEQMIGELPPAQPERIKGHWIHHPEIGWGETWLCDQCGEKTTSTVMGKPRANFCPNCGADMRGEQE